MARQTKNLLDEDLEDETDAMPAMRGKDSFFVNEPSPKLAKAFVEARKRGKALPARNFGGKDSFSSRLDFFFMGKNVRMHSPRDGEFWFCAADVCKALDYKDAAQAIKLHCLGEPVKRKPDDAAKLMVYISESDLYNLALRSSKPNAEPFRRWITEEVIPSLRRTGEYFTRKLNTEGLPPAKPEPLPAKDEQLEMFPRLVKLNLKANLALYNMLASCRTYLKGKGTTFPTHEDYIGFLLEKGLENVGFAAEEEI